VVGESIEQRGRHLEVAEDARPHQNARFV
jgi:hypothetical protein